jgi:hypothetical protein
VNAGTEFSPGFSEQFYQLTSDSLYYIHATATVRTDAPPGLELVMEMHEHMTDQLYDWRSMKGSNAIKLADGQYLFVITAKIPGRKKPEDKLKLYFWDHAKQRYFITNMNVSSFADMNYYPVQEVKQLFK